MPVTWELSQYQLQTNSGTKMAAINIYLLHLLNLITTLQRCTQIQHKNIEIFSANVASISITFVKKADIHVYQRLLIQ